MQRRSLLAGAGVVLGLAAMPRLARAQDAYDPWLLQDFDELWRTLGERYGFFGDKPVDWDQVRTVYRPMAAAANTRQEFAEVVRQVLAELYDAHTHLNQEWEGAPRWPPFDIRVEPDVHGGIVTDVQPGSSAEQAEVAPGDWIVAVDGQLLGEAYRQFYPRCLTRQDPAAYAHALNVAVAGRRGAARRLELVRGAEHLFVDLPLSRREALPDLSHERQADGVGRIAIRSFGAMETIDAFDAALAELQDAPGLILDVRGNGGGDTAVARPIMGRFISERAPYATMRRREGAGLSEPWIEYVEPRGPFTYGGPVVVLTDAWSASMAEGFPMGMRALLGAAGRCRIVGRPMMGLGAAVFPLRLDRTGIELQYSAEPVYTPDGQPRWTLRPDVETAPDRDILQVGLGELGQMIAARS